MIDVSKYIEQLTRLRKILILRIDGYCIDENDFIKMTPKKIIEIYFETGYLFPFV